MKSQKSKKTIIGQIVGFLFILFFLISGTIVAREVILSNYDSPNWAISVSVDVYAMFICAILYLSCVLEKTDSMKNKLLMQLFLVICLQICVDIFGWMYYEKDKLMLEIFYFAYYFFSPVAIMIYWRYLRYELDLSEKKYSVQNIAIYSTCIANMLLYCSNWIHHKCYFVDENLQIAQGPLSNLKHIYAAVALVVVTVTVINQELSGSHKRILIGYMVFPSFAYLIDYYTGQSLFYPFMLISTILIYTQVYLSRGKVIVEQENTLSKQSVALMISQIQPHFIYNTLTTISNLCRKDPKEAEEVTVMFSHYLRMNLDSLKKMEPVPFAMELQHVQTYLDLEKKRFGDQLMIEYDIQADHFKVPALSIQPIAENSVKHGIREKGEAGTLKISSMELENCYQVIVEDDGVGFDTSAPPKDDGRSHVGMSNVVDRLKKMCNAETEIISSPGNGCKTLISFPKDKRKD